VNGYNKRGGGLAFIYKNSMSAKPLKIKFTRTSFELQLVGLQVFFIYLLPIFIAPPARPSQLSLSLLKRCLWHCWASSVKGRLSPYQRGRNSSNQWRRGVENVGARKHGLGRQGRVPEEWPPVALGIAHPENVW